MSVGHVNELPPELLAKVFEVHQDETSQRIQSLAKLVGICKHWKDVAMSHPQLWTTLQFAVPTSAESRDSFIGGLKQWVGRAGVLPLALTLTFDASGDVFGQPDGGVHGFALYRYLTGCQLWKSLTFVRANRFAGTWLWLTSLMEAAVEKSGEDGTPCWPFLETLRICTPQTLFCRPVSPVQFPLSDIAPKIRRFEATFKWQDSTSDIISALEYVPWRQLTDFQCGSVSVLLNRPTFILHILTGSPCLKRLAVGMLDGDDTPSSLVYATPSFRSPPPSGPGSQIIHHRLQAIHVELTGDVMMMLLDRIRLPSLHLFDYRTFRHSRSSFVALHAAAQDPLFWPKLQAFRYDGGKVKFRLGEGGTPNGQTALNRFKCRPLNWWDSNKGNVIPRQKIPYNFPL